MKITSASQYCVSPTKPRSRAGFTMLELLVSVAIIAVLIGLLIPAIGMIQKRSKVSRTLQTAAMIGNACDVYRMSLGGLPPSQDSALGIVHLERMSVAPASLSLSQPGFLDLLVRGSDMVIPPNELARQTDGSAWIVDAWRQPMFYQVFDPDPSGEAGEQQRAAFWTARGLSGGRPGERGFAIYSVGPENLGSRQPDADGGGWWQDVEQIIYRRSGQ